MVALILLWILGVALKIVGLISAGWMCILLWPFIATTIAFFCAVAVMFIGIILLTFVNTELTK